ncbi:oligosaccharide flippase family protein [Jannaschia rubra]|uniref:Teichuronic acid biosynthesis protein TuaB n=1 Tax=Jannaschia rubra TaxID=282197 RepID=A0A0M6XR63_9RHOB|nr:oligosaccharide flippase family protein [Jannaschia rubra]CTQ32703.1 Teichuronic acid biosynthesis protein TuaB [Jannaschia rubra]SFF87822.1 Polysaccharide biosynthesis protein [Jannaschia rubra]
MSKTFLINVGSLSASRLFLAASQVLVLPFVARFLSPADFGDMALAMGVVVFAQLLSDAGLGRSLIRQPKLDPAEWNSVFWMLAGVGAALMLVLVAVAPVWAALFDRARLLPLVATLAVLPLLGALAAVPTARMERDDRFPALSLMRTVAGLAGIAVVLVSAAMGAGVWALVAQQVVLAATQTAMAAAMSRFRPGAPRGFTPLGHHLRFAADNIGTSLLFTGQTQAPVMILGYILGAAPLGLFSMAQRFLTLPRTGLGGPIAQVVFVRMAARQADPGAVADLYLASCRVLAFLVIVPLAVLAGAGETLFPFLLSDRWAAVAPVFALAAPGIAIEIATSTAGVMFQALDRTRLRLRMAVERMVLRTLAVAAAAPFGLEAVALAITLFSLAYTPRYLAWANRAAPIAQTAIWRAMAAPAAAGGLAWGALWIAAGRLDGAQTLAATVAVLALAWSVLVLLDRRNLRAAMSALKGGFS